MICTSVPQSSMRAAAQYRFGASLHRVERQSNVNIRPAVDREEGIVAGVRTLAGGGKSAPYRLRRHQLSVSLFWEELPHETPGESP
jgi:hypothetical protein